MGYSVAIQVRSEKLRRRFLKFMQENFRFWSVVCGKEPSEWDGFASAPTEDLCYGASKTSIGFDYQSGMYGFEREYIYSVLRWMSIKVGDRKVRMLVDEDNAGNAVTLKFPEPTPYYVYDGYRLLSPVLVVTEEQAASLTDLQKNWSVDEWGIRIGPTVNRNYIIGVNSLTSKSETEDTVALIRQEIQRLDQLWISFA